MSDRSWRVFFVVVALIVLTGVVYSLIQSSTSFKELMSDQVYDTEKISYIRIEKMGSPYDDENSVEITDPATIDRIINGFSNAKLWRTENYARGMMYSIWVNVEYTPFSIYYTEPDIIRINPNRGGHKKYSWNYRITNGYDKSIIEDLFKEE
ncbi:hypothetical protein AAXB25_20940 [Paenibacillus lautus]|uniref:hypothetical protein n=1 Tax=Paenibacillus lautus TaxID=1401 RepID=UPI003D28FFB9